MSTIATKRCSKCGNIKPITAYWKHGSTKDGRQPECRDCHNEYRRLGRLHKKGYYATERERYHDSHLIATRRSYYVCRQKVFAHYSNGTHKCARCGFDDMRALSIDHIDGNGAEHRRQLKGVNLHRWLVRNNFPPGFQVMCMNCQWIKRWKENGYSVIT